MPQQLLHAAQIAARLQHMGGKGVAQLVRVHMAVQPLLNAPLGESLLYVARRNTFAQLRQNSASSSVPNRPRKSSQCSIHATALRPIGKRRSLLPLPITQTSPLSRSRCLISVDQFGQTQSRAVHHLQHRPIAHRQRIVEIDIQQSIDVIDVNIFGRWRGIFGAAIPFAGLALSSPPTSQSKKLRSADRRSAACRANPARRLRTAKLRT